MYVMVADDQPEVRSAISLLLEQERWLHVVGEADHALGMLRIAPHLRPDLVLLDWELPGMNLQVLARLRALCPGVMVVAMSGRLEARKASLAAGAKAFISKGDPPERLLAVLEALRPADR